MPKVSGKGHLLIHPAGMRRPGAKTESAAAQDDPQSDIKIAKAGADELVRLLTQVTLLTASHDILQAGLWAK